MSSKQLKGSAKDKSLSPEEQQAKIDDVRKLIGPIADKLPVLCSDVSISRYLRARNWSSKKASKMLKETLKWRLQYKPEKIRWNTNSTSGQIKYLVYCMENALMNLNQGQEQMVWLVDFQGWSMGSVSVKVTRETAHILQDHYPERLGLGILYNPPKIFESFWTIVKPFLEPKTYKKVKFVYSDDLKSQKVMEEIFDLDKLDTAFGGRNTAGFDYQAYAQQMKEDDIRKSNFLDSSCSSSPPPSILSESHQLESPGLDHDSSTSDEGGLSSSEEATPRNMECIDEKIQELSLRQKDVQVDEAAVAAKQVH
ncbi:hypothetical protein DITRI_Ditri20bG0066500 [Diplodiscus trichospermus]